MKSKKKLISIIMNCRNGEKYLKKSLKSIINQTYKNWELIFWNNNSSDKSEKILKSIRDKRIRYFKSNQNLKLYKARNLAIDKASGKYICFLDTDDLWEKSFLKVHLKVLLKKNCNLVYSKYKIKNENKSITKINTKKKLLSGRITQELLNNYLVGISAVLIKKEIFKKIKFDPNYQIIGDFDFFIRLSTKYNFFSIQKAYTVYRVSKESFTTNNTKVYIDELRNWLRRRDEKFKKLFNLNQIRFLILKLFVKKLLN